MKKLNLYTISAPSGNADTKCTPVKQVVARTLEDAIRTFRAAPFNFDSWEIKKEPVEVYVFKGHICSYVARGRLFRALHIWARDESEVLSLILDKGLRIVRLEKRGTLEHRRLIESTLFDPEEDEDLNGDKSPEKPIYPPLVPGGIYDPPRD
jgi:hypothetical protein